MALSGSVPHCGRGVLPLPKTRCGPVIFESRLCKRRICPAFVVFALDFLSVASTCKRGLGTKEVCQMAINFKMGLALAGVALTLLVGAPTFAQPPPGGPPGGFGFGGGPFGGG